METELWRREPHPALREAILSYSAFTERSDRPVTFREFPCTFVPLILDLGSGWDVTMRSGAGMRVGAFVAGLCDGPVLVRHPGVAMCVQVNLTPLGARRLLGIPMSELANTITPLGDVLGRAGRELVDRLGDATTWRARLGIVDAVLIERLAAARSQDRSTAWAFARICAGGRPDIGSVARELGWSHRRLISRFRDEVGMPPMRVARIARLERLRRLVATRPDLGWARLAAGSGYFDQAHMARDVRDLTGLRPTQLAAAAVNFVQEEPVAAS